MKLIITDYKNNNICAWYDDKRMVQIDIINKDNKPVTGDIYVGKVKNIVPNINAAFIDIGTDELCFMQVNERIGRAPAYRRNGELVKISREKDILVQYVREGIKSKQPVVSDKISLMGRYLILVDDNNLISVSNKIKNKLRRKELVRWIEESDDNNNYYKGYIIRTNAENISKEKLIAEKNHLDSLYHGIISKSVNADTYSCIYGAPDEYMSIVRDCYDNEIDRIITDKTDIYNALTEHIKVMEPELSDRIELYNDDYPLNALYSIENNINKAVNPKVWLKSGAYIIIEPTEACTVIDVNSGKAVAGKKNKEDTIYGINKEAAAEIVRQLRLRNISGIIIVDFVDMEEEGHRDELVKYIREAAFNDPVKTTVVDITALGLVELTRHKRRKSLLEQLNQ